MTQQSEQPTEVAAPAADGNGAQNGKPPKLADGIELIGRYEDSGYEDPPYIARRSDGQIIQMPDLLYVIAEEVDGSRTYDEIADRVTEKVGRGISGDNVRFLAQEKLTPLGILAQPDGSAPQVQKIDPLLALKFRTAVLPQRLIKALTTVFYPLFWPPVMALVIAAIIAVDVWYFFIHGVAQSAREIAYQPILLLMVLGLVVIATALHEIGHATATRYGGAEPGVMGVGVYIVWPAFYTDVTDAYRLGRGGRLRVDLGGIYFNGIFVLLTAGAYALTGYEPLLILIVVQHFQVIQQLLPFLRLDGYYILSDLVGVPDLFARIKPTLKSALPGEETQEEAAALKPWVRRVTTAWVIALIPILLFTFGLMIFNLPRMFATAWDSLFIQVEKITEGGGLTPAVGVIQLIALVLPLAGISYTLTRATGRIVSGAWGWAEGAALRQALVLAVAFVAGGVATYVLIPNGDYRPIQPGERGTLQGGIQQFAAIQTGRPGLTPEREEELGGAPVVRDAPAEDDREEQPAQTATEPGATEPATTQATTPTTTTSETGTVPLETPTVTTPTVQETAPVETTTTP